MMISAVQQGCAPMVAAVAFGVDMDLLTNPFVRKRVHQAYATHLARVMVDTARNDGAVWLMRVFEQVRMEVANFGDTTLDALTNPDVMQLLAAICGWLRANVDDAKALELIRWLKDDFEVNEAEARTVRAAMLERSERKAMEYWEKTHKHGEVSTLGDAGRKEKIIPLEGAADWQEGKVALEGES